MNDPIRQIADAVLYEGYLLWPYRRSALKNQQRWTFGGVYPLAYSRSSGGTDRNVLQTQCLVETSDDASIRVAVRFLHVVARTAHRLGEGGLEPVDELVVGTTRHLTWDEATEREFAVEASRRDLQDGRRHVVDIPAGSDTEWLELDGDRVGALVRTWEKIEAVVDVRLDPIDDQVEKLTVRITNCDPWDGTDRHAAVRRTLVSTHTIMRVTEGSFISATDPPSHLKPLLEDCENLGTWPVLVGEEGDRRTMLSSPVVMYDYPRVAPESPGDMFDGGEIDQLLILNILTLTEEEQREMADTDPRAREILERTAALGPEDLMRLHGRIHDLRRLGP